MPSGGQQSLHCTLASTRSCHGIIYVLLTDNETDGSELGKIADDALADSGAAPVGLEVGSPTELNDGNPETVPRPGEDPATELEEAGDEVGYLLPLDGPVVLRPVTAE